MTHHDAARQHAGTNVLIGAFMGAVLSIGTAVVPVAGLVLAPALVAILGVLLLSKPVRYDRVVTLGAVLIGSGAVYLYGVANTVVACVGTTNFCDGADARPLLALAVALLATGGGIASVARRRARRME